MKILILSALALLLGCCGEKSGPSNPERTERWQSEELTGHRYELTDGDIVQIFTFFKEGAVAATLGTKSGPQTGPLLTWKIDPGGVLVIQDSLGSTFFRIVKIRAMDGQVITEVAGETKTYRKTVLPGRTPGR